MKLPSVMPIDPENAPEKLTPPPAIDACPMDRTAFSVCNLEDSGNDLEYWLTRTPEERIQAIEYMRHMLYGTDPVNDRIQRVLEIVDLPPPRSSYFESPTSPPTHRPPQEDA